MQRVDGAVDDVRTPMADADRVTIRCRMGDSPNPDGTVRTRDVFDDDRLTKRASHALRHDTGDGVSRPARRKGNDDRDWTRRIDLRRCAADTMQHHGENEWKNLYFHIAHSPRPGGPYQCGYRTQHENSLRQC